MAVHHMVDIKLLTDQRQKGTGGGTILQLIIEVIEWIARQTGEDIMFAIKMMIEQ